MIPWQICHLPEAESFTETSEVGAICNKWHAFCTYLPTKQDHVTSHYIMPLASMVLFYESATRSKYRGNTAETAVFAAGASSFPSPARSVLDSVAPAARSPSVGAWEAFPSTSEPPTTQAGTAGSKAEPAASAAKPAMKELPLVRFLLEPFLLVWVLVISRVDCRRSERALKGLVNDVLAAVYRFPKLLEAVIMTQEWCVGWGSQ